MKKRAGRPRVIANFAITADGKVSTRNFTPTGFTSKADKRRLQEIRCLGDALLVGARTVSVDQMSMGVSASDLRDRRRAAGLLPEPLRIIVSNKGHIDPCWKVFQRPGAPIVIFSTQGMRQISRASIAPLADLWIFDHRKLISRQCSAYCEPITGCAPSSARGGPSLFRALLEIGAIDELHLTWAPVIFGGAGSPTLTGIPGEFLPKTIRRRLKKMEVEGGT